MTGNIEHSTDGTLAAINSLRGYRCAEQGPFLAHVDAVHQGVCALASQHAGAVEALVDIVTAEIPRDWYAPARASRALREMGVDPTTYYRGQ